VTLHVAEDEELKRMQKENINVKGENSYKFELNDWQAQKINPDNNTLI
jgi:hypothetical protein